MKFSEIFAAFGSNWPRELVNTSWPPTGSPTSLLASIDNTLVVHGVAADVGTDGTLAVTGVLKLAHPELAPSTVPMVSGLFPSFTFTFAGEGDWSSPFRMSIAGTTTFTVQVDNLPLGVGLPADLLSAHPVEAQRGADTDIDLTEGANLSVIKRNFAFTLEAMPGRDQDKYGRDLRVVVRSGRSLGDQLVAEGLARTWSGRREPWC